MLCLSQKESNKSHLVSWLILLIISSTESILQKIHEAGFEVAFQKELVLTKEQAEEFYKEHKDKEYFESLTNHMSRYIIIEIPPVHPSDINFCGFM